ncbi:MAG: hypothetical protein J6127_00305 [Clostridiales bacterium]|nr:hypothetical protein [Clostridiales bacterium]
MKRFFALVVAAAVMFSLAACDGAQEMIDTTEGRLTETEFISGVGNPWTEVETVGEAAEGSGVGEFTLPEDGSETSQGEIHWFGYSYMNEIAEATGSIGSANLMVRKGLSEQGGDISGDFTDYEYEWTQDVDGLTVNCYGNEEGSAMLATWAKDGCSYCFMIRGQGDVYETYGLEQEAVTEMVSSVN